MTNPHIGQSFTEYLNDEGVREEVEAEALTQLSEILHADQADAAVDTLARQVARYYRTLTEAGMRKGDAAQLTATFHAMAVGQHFGLDVAEAFGVGPIYGEEG